jgi:hypothetical protein
MILTNTHPSNKSSLKINTKFDFKEFIHNCYIESARIFYNNPYLFYHKQSIYDINRNQKDAKDNIKNAIIEAIRKMLPLKMIINEYLGNSFKDDSNVNIDVTLSEAEKHNLNNMIKIDNTKNNDFVKIAEEFKQDKDLEKEPELKIVIELETENKNKNKFVRKSEQEIKYKLENRISSYKKSDKIMENISEKKGIEDDCESISYYKTDPKKKVEDSFSNINTQQIFYNNFSVELSDEVKMSANNKLNININKPRKIIN